MLLVIPIQAAHAAGVSVRIAFTSADGEEREEEWPSIERFRSWAVSEGLVISFSAYEEDDGEWVLVEKGRVGRGR